MPHLALPTLAAYLRSHGVEVIQRDLNVETFDQLLTSRYLRATHRQLRQERRRTESQEMGPCVQQARLEAITWAEEHGREVAAEVEEAKAIVRSARFFDPQQGLQAFLTVESALHMASAPYHPSELYLTRYDSAYPVDASEAIRVAAEDRHYNPFRGLFQTMVLPQICRERPEVIGISLTSAGQAIAAFTLASLIKEAGLPTHLVLGGKMVTCWRDQLPRASALWDLFDSAVAFEGEVALLRLIEALDRKADLQHVPNLMYRSGDHIRVNDTKAPEPAGDWPAPDFRELNLDQYLAPARVLPVSASRGCYWGRCAFCNVGYGESCTFGERQGTRVAQEMLTLSRRYSVQHFFFADEALSPRMLKTLSADLIRSGANLNWACCARFEPGLNAALLHQMRGAGCRMVLYGLESGSQRVLDRMHKGTHLEYADRILREGAAAGIWNHIFFFFGFPGETEEQALQTIEFVRAHGNVVHSLCTGAFLLERHSPVAAEPTAYGISQIHSQPDRDLAYYDEYDACVGIAPERAEQIEAQFLESLPDKAAPHLYVHDIYRFLYACHFQEGQPFPTMSDS